MWDLMQFEKNTALINESGEQLTYHDIDAFSKKICSFIEKRCVVFCLCTNSIGSIAGYIGFMQNNIVPLLLNTSIDTNLLQNLITAYKPAYIWKPKGLKISFISSSSCFEQYDYELICCHEKDYSINTQLGLLLTTSGSTGSPKFVRQSYHNVKINAEQIADYLGLTCNERPITTLPMNYTYGLSIINSHLIVGATILVTDKSIMQKPFWDFLKSSKATSLGGVPYTYEMLDRMRFTRMDLPDIRYLTQAGGKLSPDLHSKFAKYAIDTNKKFIVMYGQCEATARMAYLPAEHSLRKVGYIGVPIPLGNFEIVDTNGQVVGKNIPGELVYYGPNVTMGYANQIEDLSLEDQFNGRLETGDMAICDEEGYYKIIGRKKRFLKVFGNRVNMDELETLLNRQFDNNEFVCTGIDDHIHIFIQNDSDMTDLSEVKKYISNITGLNMIAFHITKIDLIPRNDSGKIAYRELEQYINKM